VSITGDNQLIVLHESPVEGGRLCLRSLLCANQPLGEVLIYGLLAGRICGNVRLAAPARWGLTAADNRHIFSYNGDIAVPDKAGWRGGKNNSYLVVANGGLFAKASHERIREAVSAFAADIVFVNIEPTLAADHEKLQLTSQGQLAGIRRVYDNSAQRSPLPADWPCYVFIRASCLTEVFGGGIPTDFSKFLEAASKKASISSVCVGGEALDIETPRGLLEFAAHSLKLRPNDAAPFASADGIAGMPEGTSCSGEVIIGRNVRIGDNVRLIGPAIIGDNAALGDGVIAAGAIIGSGVSVAAKEAVYDRLLIKSGEGGDVEEFNCSPRQPVCAAQNNFRMWPLFSYVRFLKRAADIIIAAAVLALFAPVIAIVAAAVKATSRGPVFFGHGRQGLHGRVFHCLKFRSMIVGADDLQKKLRVRNEVDGPQFKMDDDPRVTPIGEFLRDTYLDEIPQFFNVLLGHMSVIGPRPSPEAENSQCAYWRDARLSVRPGITGLWQVCRTRKSGIDFQEWVHYDSRYVRNLSFKLDIWIFWQTVKYLAQAFLKQF
jgi:lipopolysaccharide/colanic/teichoic acid biosynthesis glycosyltransferase